MCRIQTMCVFVCQRAKAKSLPIKRRSTGLASGPSSPMLPWQLSGGFPGGSWLKLVSLVLSLYRCSFVSFLLLTSCINPSLHFLNFLIIPCCSVLFERKKNNVKKRVLQCVLGQTELQIHCFRVLKLIAVITVFYQCYCSEVMLH